MVTDCEKSPGKPAAERLIEVAGEIFAQKGPAATVREICTVAGCSVAAINYHFGDKHQLYLRCVQQACERKQRLFPLPETIPADLTFDGAAQLLRTFLRTIANRMANRSNTTWHNTLMLKEVIAPSPGVSQLLREPFRRDFRRLLQVIEGLLRPADTETAIDTQVNPNDDSARINSFCLNLSSQILSQLMFLRTGKNVREMLELNAFDEDEPDQYADAITDNILWQVKCWLQDDLKTMRWK